MTRNLHGVVLLVTAALAVPVFSQLSRARTSSAQQPYTAEYKITQVQKLADGNTITRESTEVISRDTQGRQMIATKEMSITGDQTPKTRFTIFDRVARTNTMWTTPGERVTVLALPEPGAVRACTSNSAAANAGNSDRPSHTKPVVENLGTETFNGIEAHGVRYTTTVPAGEVGNLAPLLRVREEWRTVSPGRGLGDLGGITVRETSDDPQHGSRVKELVNLDQREPDESTFQPPSGYEVVKQAETMTCQGAEAAGSASSQQ